MKLDFINKVFVGDNSVILIDFPDESVDLILTSPPYDSIYSSDEYNAEYDFEDLAYEMYRVLKTGGVLVWVIADQAKNGSYSLSSFKQALFFREEVGFNVHAVMIYQKHNFSNPSSNRYHNVFEYMFIFSKGRPKTFNPIKDRKVVYAGQTCWGKNTYRKSDGSLGERQKRVYSEYGMRHNIWLYKTGKGLSTKDKIAYNHPAIFPDDLARDHIMSWTNEDDIVLDPFAGSGTTLKMAFLLNRRFVGIEYNEKYVIEIIKPRLKQYGCDIEIM